MKHRIRAAALITEAGCILLVKHVHPQTGITWWIPPGGGLETGDSSIFDCARREVFEETGLQVDLDRVVYLREFFDLETQTHHMELYLSTRAHSGEPTIEHVRGSGPDEHYIKDVRWIDQKTIRDLVVYPEILKDGFWQDLSLGFPRTRYLGSHAG